jgi:hypothetical protein
MTPQTDPATASGAPVRVFFSCSQKDEKPRDGEAIQVDPHAAGKRTWFGIFICLVENVVIRDGSLLDWRVRHGLQNISQQIHGAGSDGKFIAQECAAKMVQARCSTIGRY